jgi:small subunit ribosomal protein S17
MKVFEGKVISTGMERTAVVEIFRTTPHPLYKKLIKRSKKYKVDNFGFENAVVGSVVTITEIKPMSKGKYFKIAKIVTVGEGSIPQAEVAKVGKASEGEEVKVSSVKEAKPLAKRVGKTTKGVKIPKEKKENK